MALLEARNIDKSFPGVRALRGVSLTVQPGETVAVIGENGAGKSTLMKILAGIQQQDAGDIRIDGEPVVIATPRDAERLGIVLIHQELNLADNLSVGANIYLGREPRRLGVIDRGAIARNARAVLRDLQLALEPRTIVSTLAIGTQQMVEIARALAADARLLIMDEPTSSLSQHEAEQLFRMIDGLRARGVAIVYISHRLGEVKRLADRVVVLRDGAFAGELDRESISHDAMVRLMVGRDVSQFYARKPRDIGATTLEAKKVVTPAHPEHAVSLQVRAGEIVGLAGLVGAGRSELLRSIFGIEPPLAGSLHVAGKATPIRNPIDAIRAGLALVPEDRKQQGLIIDMVVRENVSLASLRFNRGAGGLLDRSYEKRIAAEMIHRLSLRTPHDRQVARFLSGGNQQKVVLAKWLALKPRVLLMDEPTRGIDVGSKEEIYRLMEELAETGVAILFASSEMEEILGISDRVLVMHEGSLAGDLHRDSMTEERIMHLATGGE